MDDVKLFYDLTAEPTADEWYEKDVVMPTIRDLISVLPKQPRVLDLGCGPGYESMRLASTGAQVVGVDDDEEAPHVAAPQERAKHEQRADRLAGAGTDGRDLVEAAVADQFSAALEVLGR